MAKRRGLRVNCAVCNRIFYIDTWGEELPEHNIGRGGSPACAGSLRTDYRPASEDAMTAQMEWAAGQVPDRPAKRKSEPESKATVVDARRAETQRLKTRIAKATREIEDLVEKGGELQERRASEDTPAAMATIAEQEQVLRDERSLRMEVQKAEKELARLER